MTANHHSRRSPRRQPSTAQSAGGGSSLSGSARCPCLVAPPEDADGGGPSTHPAGGVNIPRVLSVIVGGGIARRIRCHSAGGGTAGGKHPGRPRSRQLTSRRRQRSAGQAACPRADRSRASSGSAPRRPRLLIPIASVTAVLAIIATLVAVRLTSAERTAGRNGGQAGSRHADDTDNGRTMDRQAHQDKSTLHHDRLPAGAVSSRGGPPRVRT